MEADNIGIYSALLFQCQFTGCMLVNLKFICTGWVSLLVLFRRSLVLLGSWTSLGRVSVFPVMNSEGSCLIELIILRLFHFTTLLQFKYFSRLYSKFVCLWFVFSGREGLYRWTNSILCPFILRDPFKWHVCTAGIAGGRRLGYLSPAKLIFLIFLLMDSGWGLALLGPRLFIFSLGRTACFCVKKVQNFFPFSGGGGPRPAVCRFLFVCKHFRRAYLLSLKT